MNWLTDEDIYSHLKKINVPSPWDRSWVRVGDSFMLNSFYKTSKDKQLKKNIIKKCFEQDAIHTLIKYILPVNIQNEHWILFVVDIEEHLIYTYNSYARSLYPRVDGDYIMMGSQKHDEMEAIELYKIKSFLHWYGKTQEIPSFYNRPWLTIYCDYVNNQTDTWSCGYYILCNIMWQCTNQSFASRLDIIDFESEYDHIVAGRASSHPTHKRFKMINTTSILEIECANKGPVFFYSYNQKTLQVTHFNISPKNYEAVIDQESATNMDQVKKWMDTHSPVMCDIGQRKTSVRLLCNHLLAKTCGDFHFGIENFGLQDITDNQGNPSQRYNPESLVHSFSMLLFSIESILDRIGDATINIYIGDPRVAQLESKRVYSHPLQLHREQIQVNTRHTLSFLDEMYELGRMFLHRKMRIFLFSDPQDMTEYLSCNQTRLWLTISCGPIQTAPKHHYYDICVEYILFEDLEFHVYVSTPTMIHMEKIFPQITRTLTNRVQFNPKKDIFTMEFEFTLKIMSPTMLSTSTWTLLGKF